MQQITIESLATIRGNELIPLNCHGCGEKFNRICKLVRSGLKRGDDKFFCCKACYDNWSKNRSIHENKCLFCNVIFEGGKDRKFCSSSCSAKYNKNGRFGKNKPKLGLREYFKNKCEKEGREYKPSCEKLSPKPHKINSEPLIDCKCGNCNNVIKRRLSDISKSKMKKVFCSKSCRMTVFNLEIKELYGSSRSEPEKVLCEIISNNHTGIRILTNKKNVLSCRYELDIYIPDKKIAIEINGITHYQPIYGEEKLLLIKERDRIKKEECEKLGITLLVFDISSLKSQNIYKEYMQNLYEEHIRPLISDVYPKPLAII